jgi:Ca-activated chloride channel family protein
LDGISGDTLPGNNSSLAIVDVRGRLRMLYIESDAAEARYLTQAMEKEGVELDLRQPGNLAFSLDQLAGYDGVILSDVPAHQLGEPLMNMLRDYIDKLGGGLLMLGGPGSFGTGGYYRTPIEETLPVRLKAPDEEEKQSAAVAIVMDRSPARWPARSSKWPKAPPSPRRRFWAATTASACGPLIAKRTSSRR